MFWPFLFGRLAGIVRLTRVVFISLSWAHAVCLASYFFPFRPP